MIKTYFLALVWLAVITILSVIPGIQLPEFNLFSADKLAHAFVYCVLVVVILHGHRKQNGGFSGKKSVAGAFLFATFYGVAMEFVQGTFFPGRFCEFDDMIANAFGALVGTLIFSFTTKTHQKT